MLLQIGSKGEEVRILQTKLGLDPDGSFGPDTEKKVKEWQLKNNLPASGIIDEAIWGKFFAGQTPDTNLIIPPSNFKLENLRGHVPDAVLVQIPETALKFNINSSLRLAHFLSQCHHESTGFKDVFEKLNYSSDRLKVVFKKYFPDNLSDSYANNPAKIASKVYASRMGNGDEASGDGYTFRGRGYLQLTGREMYAGFAKFIGEDTVANPDLVASKYPLSSAAFVFNVKKLWTVCDKGETEAIVTAVTQLVNGGLIGLPDRISHFNVYNNLLK